MRASSALLSVEGYGIGTNVPSTPIEEPTSPNAMPEQLRRDFLERTQIREIGNDTKTHESASKAAGTAEVLRIEGSRATLLAEWSGCVLSIDEHFFYASLKGIYGEGIRGESEEADVPISDVSESDMELLHPGHFFRLCVFYEISEDGQPRRYTQVVFRRLPAYRKFDLERAESIGEDLFRGLRVE